MCSLRRLAIVTAIEPFRPFQSFDRQDVIGFDYATLKDVSGSECAAACKRDSRCRAATYNKPARFCFLKDNAAVSVWNKDALAYVETGLAGEVLSTSFTIQSNKDMPGNDYLHVTQATFVGCFVACATDARCQAFAYIRKKNSCWLKDRLGLRRPYAGVDIGVR
jgi:hypothetical protein